MTDRYTSEEAASIPDFPMARADGCPLVPPPQLQRLSERAPISRVRLWDGNTPWLVTSYAEQRSLLSDPRVSADIRREGYPHVTAGIKARHADTQLFINMDDPEHHRLRRMVISPFGIKRVEAMRPTIQRIVDGLIDDLLQSYPPADLVQQFALPVPSIVICEILGVPYTDHAFFQRNSNLIINRDSKVDDVLGAQNQLVGYLEEFISQKLADPTGDMLSRLAASHIATGELSARDLAAMFFLLLVAGHETTANMIALGTVALLEHPSQMAALRDTRDQALISNAVEELLRYVPVVHSGRRRVALADIEIAGITIQAGDGIVLDSDLGNRDESIFPHASQLDIHRDASRHLAFGFGPHQCLGQPLARVELQVVFGTLYRRIPTLRLAIPPSQVPYKHDALIYGVYELPVTW